MTNLTNQEIDLSKESTIILDVEGNWTAEKLWKFTYSINALYDFLLLVAFGNSSSAHLENLMDSLIGKYDISYRPGLKTSKQSSISNDDFYSQLRYIINERYGDGKFMSSSSFFMIDFQLKLEGIEISSPGQQKYSGFAAVIKQLREIIEDFRFRKENKKLKRLSVQEKREEIAKRKLENFEKISQVASDLNLQPHEVGIVSDWAYNKGEPIIEAFEEGLLTNIEIKN